MLVSRGKLFTSTCANRPRFSSTLRNALSITHTVVCITTLLTGALARQSARFLPLSFVLSYSFREPVKLLSRTIAERWCFDDVRLCNLNPVMVGARVLRQWGRRLESRPSRIRVLCRCIQVHCRRYSRGYAHTNTCARARDIMPVRPRLHA